MPAPALQEGSTIDGLWGAIVPAKPASTRHGIERDRQRHKRGVLPTTLQASDSNGGSNVITFQRIIVWPVLAHRDARLCFQFLNFKI